MPSRMPESPSTASTAAKTMLLLPVETQLVLGQAALHRGHPTGMEQHPPALWQGTDPSQAPSPAHASGQGSWCWPCIGDAIPATTPEIFCSQKGAAQPGSQ